MKSLLEQAQTVTQHRKQKQATNQEIELALAWAKGDINTHQVSRVLNITSSNTYSRMASLLRSAVQQGILVERGILDASKEL
jgi:hypothetical protein